MGTGKPSTGPGMSGTVPNLGLQKLGSNRFRLWLVPDSRKCMNSAVYMAVPRVQNFRPIKG